MYAIGTPFQIRNTHGGDRFSSVRRSVPIYYGIPIGYASVAEQGHAHAQKSATVGVSYLEWSMCGVKEYIKN